MRVALVTCDHLPDWEIDDRPLHAALARRGVEVLQPAWTDPDFAWEAVDAALIRTTWDYVPRLPDFLAWADRVAARTRLFNPAPVVRWNTDKRYLRALADAGVPHPPTRWLAPGEGVDLARWCAEAGWTRGFLKPVVGASASGTVRFDPSDPDSLAAAEAHAQTWPGPLMLQPYLPRVEVDGELSAIFIDGRLSHAVQKIPVPGDYRVQDDWGATDRRIDPPPALTALADRALGATAALLGLGNPLLYARVDALWRDDGSLALTELELVEPSLFLRHAPEAADALAGALIDRTRRTEPPCSPSP